MSERTPPVTLLTAVPEPVKRTAKPSPMLKSDQLRVAWESSIDVAPSSQVFVQPSGTGRLDPERAGCAARNAMTQSMTAAQRPRKNRLARCSALSMVRRPGT